MEDTDRIIRAKTRSRFTTVDNEMREDKRLSWGARGLLLYLIGLPENWQVNITHLVNQSPEGRDATRSKLKELMTYGYVSRKQIWDKEIGKNVWLTMVYELPSMNPHFNPLTEMPREGIDPLTENPLTPFQEETPLTDFPTVQSTYIKEEEINNENKEKTYVAAPKTEIQTSNFQSDPIQKFPEITDAVFDALGSLQKSRYEMGTVSSKRKIEIQKIVGMLAHENRTVDEIILFRDNWPKFLNKDSPDPPTPRQMLDEFDRVVNWKPRGKVSMTQEQQLKRMAEIRQQQTQGGIS